MQGYTVGQLDIKLIFSKDILIPWQTLQQTLHSSYGCVSACVISWYLFPFQHFMSVCQEKKKQLPTFFFSSFKNYIQRLILGQKLQYLQSIWPRGLSILITACDPTPRICRVHISLLGGEWGSSLVHSSHIDGGAWSSRWVFALLQSLVHRLDQPGLIRDGDHSVLLVQIFLLIRLNNPIFFSFQALLA